MVKDHLHKPIFLLIKTLNPVLRGWCEHYRSVTSKKVFSAVGKYLWGKIWKLLRKRNSSLSLRELRKKYFTNIDGNRWVLFAKDPQGNQITLFQMGWVEIKRHTIVPDLNPYLPGNEEVFIKRVKTGAKQSAMANKNQSKLASMQNGFCPICDQILYNGEALEVHHRLPRKLGGKDNLSNLVLLHKLCHNQITYSKDQKLIAVWESKGLLKIDPKTR